MNSEIKFEALDLNFSDQALELVISAYKDQKRKMRFLPTEEFYRNDLKKSIHTLFKNGRGIIAKYDDKLIGFLAGYEVNEFFGLSKGIYIPLYGSGVKHDFRDYLYTELYKHAADLWVKNKCLTHAITLFESDQDVINQWFWLEFGLRCVDSIRKVSVINQSKIDIKIEKLDLTDIHQIADIHRDHNQYYKYSPIFMPREEEDPIQDLTEWLTNENHHIWAAYYNEEAVGYMRIQPNAESFVSTHPSIMNVTGAYIINDERRSGIGALLLDEIQHWLIKNNYLLCGVDFESINTTGSKFWNKYFTPYTYSLVRRIDERINT